MVTAGGLDIGRKRPHTHRPPAVFSQFVSQEFREQRKWGSCPEWKQTQPTLAWLCPHSQASYRVCSWPATVAGQTDPNREGEKWRGECLLCHSHFHVTLITTSVPGPWFRNPSPQEHCDWVRQLPEFTVVTWKDKDVLIYIWLIMS